MSLKSVLDHVGQIAIQVLHFGEVAAVIASPVISAQFGPGIGAAVQSGVVRIMQAEQAAKAAGKDKAGAEKLASVEQSLIADLPAIESEFQLTVPQEKQAAYAQLLYNLTTMFEPVAKPAVAPAA
jgi:hypothetical protein